MKRSLPLLLAAGALLAGCATNSQPKALDTLYSSYEADRVARYKDPASAAVVNASKNSAERNDLINDLILIIDHRYGETEKTLYAHKSLADFTGSVLATGLGTAGTLSGVTSLKTTLSALVTAIDATKVSFNKDILQDQSTLAVIATMRKARAEKLLQIRYSEKLPIRAYPLSLSLDDLIQYYQAGTFVAALQALTEDAAAGKKAADDKLNALSRSSHIPAKTTAPATDAVIPPANQVPPKADPPKVDGIIGPAETGPAAPANTVPPKTEATHPTGVIPPGQ